MHAGFPGRVQAARALARGGDGVSGGRAHVRDEAELQAMLANGAALVATHPLDRPTRVPEVLTADHRPMSTGPIPAPAPSPLPGGASNPGTHPHAADPPSPGRG